MHLKPTHPNSIRCIELHQFKGFQHVVVDQLAMINVFVGENSCGKTSLLQALIVEYFVNTVLIMGVHNDPTHPIKYSQRLSDFLANFGRLFSWTNGLAQIQATHADKPEPLEPFEFESEPYRLGYNTKGGGNGSSGWESDKLSRIPSNSSAFFQFNGYLPTATDYYRKLTLDYTKPLVEDAELEANIIALLQCIEPRLVDMATGINQETQRIELWFGTDDKDERVELANMGEGFIKLVGLAMAVWCSGFNSFYLDELENGLHFSVQQKVWKLLLEAAYTQGVRVFVTTHSYEMLQSLNTAYRAWLEEKGLPADYQHPLGSGEATANFDMLAVYGLQKQDDHHRVKRFTAKQLNTLLEYDFELRSLLDFEE